MISTSVLLILGLGGPEIALIVFAMLMLFGAKKIPDLARGLGKGIREFKDATKDVKNEIDKTIEENK
jgi:sec-independent protein translocase protein TatA